MASLYRVDRVINCGNYGTVYKGAHIPTGNVVAIKRIPLRRADKPEVDNRNAIYREEKNWELVSGKPNILKFETSYEEDMLFRNLVCEYCEDGDLEKMIKNKIFMESEAKTVLKQVCRAVNACHLNDIVHADVKPANVLIASDGTLKLGDFGNSHTCLAQHEGVYNRRATPAFAAPEVWEGAYGLNVDVWAIGVFAYTLLARGELPFLGESQMELAHNAHYNSVPWDGFNVSKEGREFVEMCLTKDNLKRPSIDEVMKHSFLVYSAYK